MDALQRLVNDQTIRQCFLEFGDARVGDLGVVEVERLQTGQHFHCADGTPLENLWLTQAQLMGLKRERFADSTGTVQQLLT